jgi:hypothetical protein
MTVLINANGNARPVIEIDKNLPPFKNNLNYEAPERTNLVGLFKMASRRLGESNKN